MPCAIFLVAKQTLCTITCAKMTSSDGRDMRFRRQRKLTSLFLKCTIYSSNLWGILANEIYLKSLHESFKERQEALVIVQKQSLLCNKPPVQLFFVKSLFSLSSVVVELHSNNKRKGFISYEKRKLIRRSRESASQEEKLVDLCIQLLDEDL